MPRDLPIGNGSILVAFDKEYRLRELYFPHVGEENHTKGEPFRFGIWIDGQFEWLPGEWQITRDYLEDSLVTHVELTHKGKELKIIANDLVDFHENLYLKKLTIENGADRPREIRLFFAHDFHLYGHEIGDTAVFYPENKTLVHYKAERHFLINVYAEGRYGIHTYATGNKVPGLFEGTWKDAEDGQLSGNPIAQGSVDSVVSLSLKIGAKSQESCFYWICCGKNREEVTAMNHLVQKRGPASFLTRTYNYWKCWVNKEPLNEKLLPPKVLRLYKRSLLIARSQINQCGSIIAANDSDVMQFNRDTYSYLWPRDGALVAHALDLAGYGSTTDFYRFCDHIIEKEGYFLHKYTPSGSVASSWHPWIKEGRPQLPIQEDETALVLWALWEHYKIFRDIEFIKPLYKNLIKRSADFLMNYRDPETGLPLPSYDLWEERQGILTFTAATVYGGLKAAAHFTEAFGEHEIAKEYLAGAERLKEAMDRHLYLDDKKRFARMIRFLPDGSVEVDDTIDDQAELIQRAVKLFNEEGVSWVFHCGDWVAPFILYFFQGLKAPLGGVFGNNDGDKFRHLAFKDRWGLDLDYEERFLEVDIEGRRIAVFHGDYPGIVDSLVAGGKYDVLFHGHTHKRVNEHQGKTLSLNPGSLMAITSKNVQGASCAIYDSQSHTARHILF